MKFRLAFLFLISLEGSQMLGPCYRRIPGSHHASGPDLGRDVGIHHPFAHDAGLLALKQLNRLLLGLCSEK